MSFCLGLPHVILTASRPLKSVAVGVWVLSREDPGPVGVQLPAMPRRAA